MTLRLLADVCACFGCAVDEALESPGRVLEGEVSLQAAQEFLSLMGVDMMDLSPEDAHTEFARAASGFFLRDLPAELGKVDRIMTPVWKRAGVPNGGGGISLQRALAYADFGDYQRMLDAPLSDTLVFLNLRAINAAHDKRN